MTQLETAGTLVDDSAAHDEGLRYNKQQQVENAVSLAATSASLAADFLRQAEDAETADARSFALGMASYEAKDYDNARALLVESYELSPSANTAARLGVVGYRQEDWYFAEEWLALAEDREPSLRIQGPALGFEIACASMMAFVQARLGRSDRAIELATNVIETTPDAMAYRARATAYLIEGRVSEAIADVKRARAIAPASIVNELAADVELMERVRAAELSGTPIMGEITMTAWPV